MIRIRHIGYRKVSILGAVIVFLVMGCNAFHHSWAWIIPNGEYIEVKLNKKTSELAFGHSGLHFIMEVYNLKVPHRTGTPAVFTATEVVLTSASSRTKQISRLVSGEMVIDSDKVTVSLMTEDGPFPGNGEYSSRWFGSL